jgi:hypothetical protein
MGWDTYHFLANNIEDIYSGSNTVVKKRHKSNIPKSVVYAHNFIQYLVYDNGVICHNALYDLYFNYHSSHSPFDWCLYYALYHNCIDIKYEKNVNLTMEQKTILYYIKYGFWYGMRSSEISIQTVKAYRATYPDMRYMTIVESRNHLMEYKRPILFSSWMYMASNYEYLKHILPDDLADHYVTNGIDQGLNHDTFNHTLFLSEYPGCISRILKKEYDTSLLTSHKVSEFFIMNKHRIDTYKTNVPFNAEMFVKEFLNDKRINDAEMCINNAYVYFVRGFVEYKDVRNYIKRTYMMKRFMRKRFQEALVQIPFGIIRYIIEMKMYI